MANFGPSSSSMVNVVTLTGVLDNSGNVTAISSPSGTSFPLVATQVLALDANGNTIGLKGAGGVTVGSSAFIPAVMPRDLNIHSARLAEPLVFLDLPSPYFLNATTTKKEHAYGTPIFFPSGFNGYRFWMVGAPYPTTEATPLATAKYENPCIYASNDGENFVVPQGLTNPIATSIGLSDVNSYYNDPAICASPDGKKLYVIFGWTNQSGATKNSLLVTESIDGINWSAPVAIYSTTSTTFNPNSASLFWNGVGWTCVIVETQTAKNFQVMTTPNATPYTGWSAFAAATAVHPLGRPWWHAQFYPLANGGIIGMAVDNNSAGGSVYTLKSSNNGVSFSVQPFCAFNSGVSQGSFYRPSLCLVNDGTNAGAIMYASRIAPLSKAGFWMQKAKLAFDSSIELGLRESLRNSVQAKVSTPVNVLKRSLLAWDSFQRIDSAIALGAPDGSATAASWVLQTGTWGISTNRAYITNTGNNIATLDLGSSDYEFEYQVQTMGSQLNSVFGFVDTSNFYRVRSNGPVERIVGGAVDKTYGNVQYGTPIAGDVMRIKKEGVFVSIYYNDRIVDCIALTDPNDGNLRASTIVGIQASGVTPSYVVNFMARLPG